MILFLSVKKSVLCFSSYLGISILSTLPTQAAVSGSDKTSKERSATIESIGAERMARLSADTLAADSKREKDFYTVRRKVVRRTRADIAASRQAAARAARLRTGTDRAAGRFAYNGLKTGKSKASAIHSSPLYKQTLVDNESEMWESYSNITLDMENYPLRDPAGPENMNGAASITELATNEQAIKTATISASAAADQKVKASASTANVAAQNARIASARVAEATTARVAATRAAEAAANTAVLKAAEATTARVAAIRAAQAAEASARSVTATKAARITAALEEAKLTIELSRSSRAASAKAAARDEKNAEAEADRNSAR